MRRLTALGLFLVVCMLLGTALSATTTYQASQGVTYQTNHGLNVTMGQDIQVQSGNPFVTKGQVKIRNTTLASNGNPDATLEGLNSSELSGIDTRGHWLHVNNTDDRTDRNVSINGQASRLEIYNQSLSRNDTNTDFLYDTNSNPDIRINNSTVAQGATVLAIDQSTDSVIAEGQAAANGTVEFESMDSGFHRVDLQQGPSVLSVYNETKPTQLVDENATLRIRFFEDDDIVEREVTDGTVSLSGVPKGDRLIVTVKENESDFTYRRIILESLFEQEEVYLLHESQPALQVVFQLNDKTGNFDPTSSRLFVEKPIRKDFDGDGSNETQYQTIVGDRFGADGRFPATIQPDERYRLRVVNSNGDSRVLGAYSASTGGVIEVPIGSFSIEGRGDSETSFGTALDEVNDSRVVRVRYEDPTNSTRELDIEVLGDSPNTTDLQPNTTQSGPFGTFTASYQLPAGEPGNATYKVRFHAERDGRDDVGGTRFVGSVGGIFGGLGVDPQVLTLLSWVGLVAMTGGVVLIDDRLAAFVAVAIATGLTMVGPLSIPSVALGIAGMMAIIWNVARVRA